MLPTKTCSGCKACAAACPKVCISFERNHEGFWYPVADADRCVKCGLCEQVCPVLHAKEAENENVLPPAVAAWSRTPETRASSSSGGVFGEFAAAVIASGGIVCGAALDEAQRARHIFAETMDQLEKLRGSKYVQSDVGDCYGKVREHLINGRTVLFSGTPCQVAGLKSFLGCDYENLITVDIICHGVPSPLVWERYLEHQKKRYRSDIRKAGFRDKTEGWAKFSMSLQFENGEGYRQTLKEDAYMKAFLENLCLRESCHQCSFKSIRRMSDLTIGDFWGVDKLIPGINDDQGISLVILQSEKGHHLFKAIEEKLRCRPVDCKAAADLNGAATHSVYRHPFRDYFFKKLPHTDFEKLVQNCLSPSYLVRLERKLITHS